jgi:hypothetical protein
MNTLTGIEAERVNQILNSLTVLARQHRTGWQPDLNTPYANATMLFTAVTLVASRMHYTVDCVLAVVLCHLLNRISLLECSKGTV